LTSPPRQKLTQILFLHEHGADDDQPLHQELHVGIDVLELKDIGEQAEDEDADERSGEAAAPAHEARAADYYRGDRIEFEAGARVRFALPVLGHKQHAGEPGQQARDHIGGQLDLGDLDAGELGCFRIAADGRRW
jgi:hypothetical protein